MLAILAICLVAVLASDRHRRREHDSDSREDSSSRSEDAGSYHVLPVHPRTSAAAQTMPPSTTAPAKPSVDSLNGVSLGVGQTLTANTNIDEACRDTFGNLCGFAPGQVWTGQFGVTARAAEQTDQNFTLTITPHDYAVLASPGATVFERFVATDNFVAISDLAAAPASVGCMTGQLAKYQVNWTSHCNAVQLTQIIDPCAHRGGLLRGKVVNGTQAPLQLYLRPCSTSFSCEQSFDDSAGYTLSGTYADTNKSFVISLGGNFGGIETSDSRGVAFITVGDTDLQQVGSQYIPTAQLCDPSALTAFNFSAVNVGTTTQCAGLNLTFSGGCSDLTTRYGKNWQFWPISVTCSVPLPKPVITTTPAPTQAPETRPPHQHFAADRKHRYERAGVMLDSDEYEEELARNAVVREFTRHSDGRFEEESDERDGGNHWRDYRRDGARYSHDDDDDERRGHDYRRDYERRHEGERRHQRVDVDVRDALLYRYRQARREEREERDQSEEVVAVGAVDPNVHLAVGYRRRHHTRDHHEHSGHREHSGHHERDSYSGSQRHREFDHEHKVLAHVSGRQVAVERSDGRVAFIDGSESE